MNEPYSDDDNYDDDYYNYDNSSKGDDLYKWYFTFDVDKSKSLSDWVMNQLNEFFKTDKWQIDNSTGSPIIQFPVNGWNPSTGNDLKFQYLGSNYHGQQIWKSKHFLGDKYNQEYRSHLQIHAAHFVRQPSYYKGMFDILN
jgi:hypothetical protein